MDLQDLAARFAAFCDGDRYRKFILQLNRGCRVKRRLLFWQEELWSQFAKTQAEGVPRSFEGISELLRRCPVHDQPLRTEEVPIVYGLVQLPQRYLRARDERSPFANEVVWRLLRGPPGESGRGRLRGVPAGTAGLA